MARGSATDYYPDPEDMAGTLTFFFAAALVIAAVVRLFERYQRWLDPAHPDVFGLWRFWGWASTRLHELHETYFFLPPPPPPPPKTTWERIASAPGDSLAYVKGWLLPDKAAKGRSRSTSPTRASRATAGSNDASPAAFRTSNHSTHHAASFLHRKQPSPTGGRDAHSTLPGYLPQPPPPGLLEVGLHHVDQMWEWGVDTTAATISFTLLPVRWTRLGVQYGVRSVLGLGRGEKTAAAAASSKSKGPKIRFHVLNATV